MALLVINRCQIITFLILKANNIENSRIELKGIVLPVYLDPNEMSGRSYFCTFPQTILLSEKENRVCTLFTHR